MQKDLQDNFFSIEKGNLKLTMKFLSPRRIYILNICPTDFDLRKQFEKREVKGIFQILFPFCFYLI